MFSIYFKEDTGVPGRLVSIYWGNRFGVKKLIANSVEPKMADFLISILNGSGRTPPV